MRQMVFQLILLSRVGPTKQMEDLGRIKGKVWLRGRRRGCALPCATKDLRGEVGWKYLGSSLRMLPFTVIPKASKSGSSTRQGAGSRSSVSNR